MHVMAILVFLAALILALGVIRDMFVTHSAQIIAALSGEHVLPGHILNLASFQAQSTAERAYRQRKNTVGAGRSSSPLAMAA
jgi:hypothetical protein